MPPLQIRRSVATPVNQTKRLSQRADNVDLCATLRVSITRRSDSARSVAQRVCFLVERRDFPFSARCWAAVDPAQARLEAHSARRKVRRVLSAWLDIQPARRT